MEENEVSKSSGSSRGKKLISKKVIEYCYEPEMEEVTQISFFTAINCLIFSFSIYSCNLDVLIIGTSCYPL